MRKYYSLLQIRVVIQDSCIFERSEKLRCTTAAVVSLKLKSSNLEGRINVSDLALKQFSNWISVIEFMFSNIISTGCSNILLIWSCKCNTNEFWSDAE